MNQLDALQAAIDTMQCVIDTAPIGDSALTGPTPCSGFTVGQLGDHIIDTHNFLLEAAGGKPVDAGETLGLRHANVAAAASAQWATRGSDGMIELGGNELPAAFGLSLHALETYIHAWDLAASLDRPFTPPAALTDAMASFAESFITDAVRGDFDGAPYAAAVAAEAGASDVDRLVAFAGRSPHWPRGSAG